MEIEKLIEISKEIGAESITKDLQFIEKKMNQSNCDLVLPLVGEFSSGKTTLINALTDSKKLETATKPTTSTIYEIHFGCNSCHAEVYDKNGNVTKINDISDLKNEELCDAPYILINDTSKLVPASTVVVDTPGLSSPDPRHKQALVNFLPQADGIILVVDVNQSITRSLTDFIKTMKLSNRMIFLVITFCDTKTPSEVETQKKNIANNCGIDIRYTACVSAKTNDLHQLYNLLQSIYAEKGNILKKINDQRLKNATEALKARIDEMLKSSSSDKELDEAIRNQQRDLERINRNIDKLINDSESEIEEVGRSITRKFEDNISQRLNSIVAGKGINFDAEAIGAVNSTASIMINEYKDKVKQILGQKAKGFKGDDSINLQSLQNIDMTNLNISEIGYNLGLNGMGHQYDGLIKGGLIAVAAIGAVAAAPAVLGGTAAGGAAAAGGMSTGEAVIEATEIAMITKNASRTARVQQNIDTITKYDNQYGQQIGQSNGIISSLVGLVTDKTMGKPQRIRAISNYIDSSLLPSFKEEMNRISNEIINYIGFTLHNEAESVISEKSNALQQLQDKQKNNKAEFEQRMSQLKKYRSLL